MSTNRIARINEAIQHEVAQSFFRIMNDPDFDLAAVTVTRVVTSSDLRHARVFVSIRGDDTQQHAMMARLLQHRHEFQAAVGKNVIMKYTPQLLFELDQSIARGAHVLEIIDQIEQEHPDWKAAPAAPAPEGEPT